VKTVLTAICYNLFFVVPTEILLVLFGRFSKKIREGLQVRKEWERNLRKSLALVPKGDRILFHAASAGELQQALPVIRKLKSIHPDWQFGISFFSVSGMNFFKGDPAVSFTTYMPFDSPKNSMLFMTLVKPKLYVIASWDMWFNHCLAARNVGAKVVMIAGVVSSDSSRLKFPLRGITAETFRLFHKIFTVAEGDAHRIKLLVGNSVEIEPAGDPRYDHILAGIADAPAKLASTHIPLWESSKIITLGSIWEPDWEILAKPLLEKVSARQIKVFAAPHQMHESFLVQIESDCVSRGILVERFSRLESCADRESLQLIIIDTIGLLAALYSRSQFAYVGGAFGKGVHNVAEPAAFGLPLWFGPNFHHSLEARRAVETNGSVSVSTAKEFEQDFADVLSNDALFDARSANTKSVVHDFSGATEIISNQLKRITF